MGFTALHSAIEFDHEEIVKLLLKHKDIDINITDDASDSTPTKYFESSSSSLPQMFWLDVESLVDSEFLTRHKVVPSIWDVAEIKKIKSTMPGEIETSKGCVNLNQSLLPVI